MSDLLYWLHLASIALGGAAVFGIPVVGAMMAGTEPEARTTMLKVAMRLSRVGHIALAALLVTGPLALWSSGIDLATLPNWFWVKLLLVLGLIFMVGFATRNTKRVVAGDPDAAQRAPKIGLTILLTYLSVLGMAVLTFH